MTRREERTFKNLLSQIIVGRLSAIVFRVFIYKKILRAKKKRTRVIRDHAPQDTPCSTSIAYCPKTRHFFFLQSLSVEYFLFFYFFFLNFLMRYNFLLSGSAEERRRREVVNVILPTYYRLHFTRCFKRSFGLL